LFLCLNAVAEQEQGRWLPALPEQSLSQWYKPVNERQVWLHTMFSLRRELQAVEEYITVRDQPHLAKWTARLVENYRRIPEMVPEWEHEVEPEVATALETAATAGDFDGAASAVRKLERTCSSCHRDYRALAAARFRAPDFSTIQVVDASAVSRSHSDHMEALSQSLNAIKIASEDERWESALDAETSLRAQLNNLGETCQSCHKDAEPKERILGQASQATLDKVRNALMEKKEKDSGRSLGEAAVQICARCHGIHRTLYDLRQQLLPLE